MKGLSRACTSLVVILAASVFNVSFAPSAWADSFFVTGSLATGRYSQSGTLLPNGKVLITGGNDINTDYLSSSELYNPATGTWTNTGSMNDTRGLFTVTLLGNGKVLAAGGEGQSALLSNAELYDPATGTWTNTGSMSEEREAHTATLLPNGKVLVAGGYTYSGSTAGAELYDPATGTWTATGSMGTPRYWHSASLLPNGKVLVAGGFDPGSGLLASAELYDPNTGTWTSTGSMSTARYFHTMTRLSDGKVLVAGGANGSSTLSSAEVYSPVTGTWTNTGSLNFARNNGAATLLANGNVLLSGGGNSSGLVATAELYNPIAGTWSSTAALNVPRSGHSSILLASGKVLIAAGYGTEPLTSAELYDYSGPTWTITGSFITGRYNQAGTLLPNGKVLIAGGNDINTDYLSSARLYNPVTGTWSNTASMNDTRGLFTLTLMANGRVLAAGGEGQSTINSSAEVYNPATGTWTTTGSMSAEREAHTATLLPNGRVLVAGGVNSIGTTNGVELYNPVNGTWSNTNKLNTARYWHTATLLTNGRVLVVGGLNPSIGVLSNAEFFVGAWSNTGPMSVARYFHTATLLANGKVLVAGGFNGSGTLSSAELYNPATGTWTNTGSMNIPRGNAAATLLADGRVLVSGGGNSSGFALAELYDPNTGTWSVTASLNIPRSGHTQVLLPNGKVLAAAGYGMEPLDSAELYETVLIDPKLSGGKSFSTVIYASTGTQLIPRYQSPTSGYAISRRVDISPFFNSIDSGTWGFDATEVPINGILKVPAGNGPFPVALFVHGNHTALDFSDEGYVYLCEVLASWGILAGTIDANFLNENFGENGARGILHLEHVRQFELWNSTTNHPLYGKVDFNNIMLVGHSRGGEGVGHASYYNTYGGSDPVVLDGSAGLGPYLFNLKALVAIAPTDQQFTPTGGPFGIHDNYLIIHGSRDGDVSDFQGYLTYDRAQPIDPGNPTQDAEGLKALCWSIGANHNYFNSTWDNEGGPTLTRAEQENVAKVYISAMAQGLMLNRPSYLDLLRNHAVGKTWLPGNAQFISQYQEAQRQFIDHYEEDSNAFTLSPPTSGSNTWSAASASEIFFSNFGDLYQETHGVQLAWSSTNHFYQANFSGSAGFNPGSKEYLVIRIGQSDDSNNPVGADQDFRIVVRDASGFTADYSASAFSRLLYPDTWNTKMVMQTLRVPLNLFRAQGLNVNRISSVRLSFDRVNAGTLYFDELQVSK